MNDMQEYLVTEFIEEYEDGNLSRHDLEYRVKGIVGLADAVTLLATVPARAETDRPTATTSPSSSSSANTAGVETENVRIPIEGGELLAYLARPAGGRRGPAILAIHENKGLVDHTRDCARRLAAAGYVTLAPDLLSREGGTDKFDANDAVAAFGKADAEQNTRDLVAALSWLAQRPDVDAAHIGVTGWCMGGGYTWRVITQPGAAVAAAVPWYGPVPQSGVENIRGPVFAIYGGLDERITGGAAKIEPQMKENGKSFEYKIYPDAQHAFNNDQNPERYNAQQAPIAWGDMLSFFKRHLGS